VFRSSALLLVPLLLAGGCSSSGGGSSSAPASSPASAVPARPSAGSAQAIALGNTMRTGMSGLTSAHIVVDAGALGGKSAGNVSYAGGRATASDITLDVGGSTELRTIGTTTYAKPPPARNTTGKPWVIVSADSKNEFVRALDSQVTISKAAASLPAIADLAATATAVQDKGTDGTGHHYALQIEPARSSGTTLGSLLADIGQKSVPVDLWLDGKGRPVLIRIAVKLGTQSFDVTIAVSRFDAPVKITAPPTDQVAT
jgi:hypothetical protein